jgi:cell division septal protein FtsQ
MNTRRTSGNRRKSVRSSSRNGLMALNVRTASMKRQRRSKVGGVVWKVSAVVIVLALLGVSARLAAQKFFFKNQEYSLRHLVTHLNGVMSDQELVALTGFTQGKNLFSLDLDQANQKLAALPEVRSVSLERVLPDTIEVGLERRLPIFLFASPGEGDTGETFLPGKSYLCDRDGVMIQPSRLDDEFLQLPVLKGVDTKGAVPGKKFENESLATAIRLEQALSELPEENFKIRSIDVSKPYAAVVTDSSNARFTFGTLGDADLPGQLERLRKLLAHCQETGRQIETANLMLSRNTPVTFVLTPETRTTKITPIPSSGKKSRN